MEKELSKEDIFNLWKDVLNNNKQAKKDFVKIYLKIFPNNEFLTYELSEDNLHTMYLHLTHGKSLTKKR